MEHLDPDRIISTRTTPPTPPPTQPARRSERPARRNFSIGGKWRSDTSGRQPECACDWSAGGGGSDGRDASIMQTGMIKNLQCKKTRTTHIQAELRI